MSAFYSERTIEEVWQKGQLVYGYNPDMYRKDDFGSWMLRTAYGNHSNSMGWEIGYVSPQAELDDETPNDLQPLQWENWEAQQNVLL